MVITTKIIVVGHNRTAAPTKVQNAKQVLPRSEAITLDIARWSRGP